MIKLIANALKLFNKTTLSFHSNFREWYERITAPTKKAGLCGSLVFFSSIIILFLN
jgi:hypothetical protein